MIIVNIKDGLGNQMFQYATAYAKSLKLNTKVLCDCRSLNEKLFNPPPNYVKREFDLDVFGIYPSKLNFLNYSLHFNSLKNILIVFFFLSKNFRQDKSSKLLERSRKTNHKLLNSKSKILYLDGYWQTENYFKDFRDEIIKVFNFNELINEKKIWIFLKK